MNQYSSQHSFQHYQRLLVRRTVISILIFGVVIALAILLPLAQKLNRQVEEVKYAQAQALTVAIEQQLNRYDDIARQVASRSQIRAVLGAYTRNEIDITEAEQFTQPRLDDAIWVLDDVFAIYRYAADGTRIAAVERGPQKVNLSAEQFERVKQQQGGVVQIVVAKELQSFLAVWMPIYASLPVTDQHQAPIGHDLVLFSVDELLATITSFNRFGANADFYLLSSDFNLVGEYFWQNGQQHVRLIEKQYSTLADVHIRLGLTLQVWQDIPHVWFVVPFNNGQWLVVVRSPAFEIFQAMLQEQVWFFLAVLLMLLLGVYTVRISIRPVLHELQKKTEQIHKQNSQLQLAGMVFDKTHEAIMITDADLTIIRVNAALAHTLGFSINALEGRLLPQLAIAELLPNNITEQVEQALERSDVWQGELYYRSLSGQIIPALQTISAVRDDDGNITSLIHIFNDITTEKSAENEIRQQAVTDQLTGLPNRAGILTILAKAMDNVVDHQQCGLLFIDLDKFKPVNDTYGHAVGDKLLQAIGPRIQREIRSADIIARLGGDEFVVVLPNVSGEQKALAIAKAIVAALNEVFVIDHKEIRIGASIGVAMYPHHAQDCEELLAIADAAMYRAKNEGRNKAVLAS